MLKFQPIVILGILIVCRFALIPPASSANVPATAPSSGEEVIQVDVSSLLNARAVTTLTNGKLVTWTRGVDSADGYLTMAAALAVGNKNPKALPDNPLIPASESRPAMLLHYSNDEGVKDQTRVVDKGDFTIPVPMRKYRGMYLALTSAGGACDLKFELNYAQGTPETRKFRIPDYFNDIPAKNPNFSYVVHDLGKWAPNNHVNEAGHHNIHAINLTPDATRELTSIKVIKDDGKYLVFWGATGVAVGGATDTPATKPADPKG